MEKYKKENIFENIWIQPAAGDAGGALGAAFAIWHKELKQERLKPIKDNMNGSYLGPSFSNKEIYDKLTVLNANFEKFSEDELLKITANELSKGKNSWLVSRKNGIWTQGFRCQIDHS